MCSPIQRRRGIALADTWATVVALSPDDRQPTTPSMEALRRFLEGPMVERLASTPGTGRRPICEDEVISGLERMALDLAHHVAADATDGRTVVPPDEARQLLQLVGRVVARLG